MTHLLFTLTANHDNEIPDFTVKCIPGEGSNSSELATALVISTAARMMIEQIVMCCTDESYTFRDDISTVGLRERFEKCGIKITVDRTKLLKEIRHKK